MRVNPMPEGDRASFGEAAPSPTLRELAMVLFRQRTVFLSVAGSIFVLAMLYAIAGTSYRSEMRVLVRRGRSDPPVAAQQNAPPDFSRVEVTEEELNSEAELLKDDDVLRQVVEANDLASHDWLRWLRPREEPAARVQRAVKRLASRLRVESVKKTNLIAVRYEDADPQLAAKVLRSLSSTYLEKHTQVHRPAGQLSFFDKQAAESRQQLEEAKQQLLRYTKTHQVVMAAQQRDLLLRRLGDVEASYRETQVEMAQTQHRIRKLDGQLAQLPQRSTSQIRTADNPELLRALKASLLDLELKKIQLTTKFEPNHPLVQEVERQIAQAKISIEAEKADPVREETSDKDAGYEWAKSELQKATVEMEGLAARGATTSKQLAEYRTRAEQLGEDAISQDSLVNDEKAAQDNYLLYVQKREEARMGDALDEGGIVNVAIAEEPVVPSLPVWSVGLISLVGFVTALGTGAGVAFAADYLDPALRTPEEVLAWLDLPVLASLPPSTGTRLSA
jgi:uncharacterized protein involved in exopolysaccharide biosynthesis